LLVFFDSLFASTFDSPFEPLVESDFDSVRESLFDSLFESELADSPLFDEEAADADALG